MPRRLLLVHPHGAGCERGGGGGGRRVLPVEVVDDGLDVGQLDVQALELSPHAGQTGVALPHLHLGQDFPSVALQDE